VTLGNGTDEYLERDARDSHHQDLFSAEISNGQRHLKELGTEITYFKFLKTATLSRFPDFKPPLAERVVFARQFTSSLDIHFRGSCAMRAALSVRIWRPNQ